jgi:hypothetical protein
MGGIGAFIGALWVRWWAVMGGSASVIGGALTTFGAISPQKYGSPETWWILAGACFLYATVHAWFDEHAARERLELERGGPLIAMENTAGGPNVRDKWQIVNAGSDAYNVTSDPFPHGDHYAHIVEVPRLAAGKACELNFSHFRIGEDQPWTTVNYLAPLLETPFRTAAGPSETMQFAKPTIQVRLRYNNSAGVEFETLCRIEWNCILQSGSVRLDVMRRVAKPTRWSRMVSRLCPLIAPSSVSQT